MSVIQGSKHALLEDTQSAVEVGEAILRERQRAVEPAPKRVTVSVDGQTVKLAEGDTVLDAIKSIGKSVPTLCYSDRMKPFGACRTCLVEVTGRKPVAACHTPVMDGASYRTSSPLISRLRRNITELIVSDHPLECLDCTANGRCELQSLAQQVGLRTPRYENPRTHHPPRALARLPEPVHTSGRAGGIRSIKWNRVEGLVVTERRVRSTGGSVIFNSRDVAAS